jgi:hypothetical protein|nr:MAG TPA: tail protein [Caudoviricetes sp.]
MLNKLFLERTELKIETDDGDLNFIFPKDYNLTDPQIINGVEIKWNYKSVNEEPNEFNVEIHGLTNTTIAKIKLKNNVRLVAGYGIDVGEIASGIITKKEVEKGTLKLKCREVPADFKKLVSSAYAPGTNASTIINDLASKCGFTVKQCELKNDKVYSIGESILGSGLYEIGQIVKDCNSQMTTKNDFIYIYHDEVDTEKVIKLSYQSGLLEEPKPQNVEEIIYKVEKKKEEKTTKKSKKAEEKKETGKEELKYDYEIKSLLIYQLKKGDLIELLSNEISTICQIVEISDISDFVMNLKVRVVNNASDIEKNNAELKEKKSTENTKGKNTQTKRKGKK